MAEPRPERLSGVTREELVRVVASATIAGAIGFVAAGYLFELEVFSNVTYQTWIRLGLGAVVALVSVAILYADVREKARARRLTAQVDDALKQSAGAGGGATVAAVSTKDVAATVAGGKANKELERLVEQRKQRLLVDQKTLGPEVAYLVDNWQPLPRDMKRGLNRFYMSYLVAYNRDLLTTEPKVSGYQLAKWLVLSERWPQLGRGLAAWPERMGALEEYVGQRGPSGDSDSDPFKRTLRGLAPLYVEDEELRTFIESEPQLSTILPRLVHYGAAQSVPTTATVVNQADAVES